MTIKEKKKRPGECILAMGTWDKVTMRTQNSLWDGSHISLTWHIMNDFY